MKKAPPKRRFVSQVSKYLFEALIAQGRSKFSAGALAERGPT